MNLFWFRKFLSYEYYFVYLFALITLIQLFYYLYFYLRIISKKKWNYSPVQHAVSVIICARNEGENLLKNLPVILKQDYPEFEVIVVNDCSLDDSEWILKQFQNQYQHLKVTHIKPDEKFRHGKKLALTIGIKAAKYDYILLTDADCKPVSDKWIARMMSAFEPGIDIVLGYSGSEHRNGLFNKLFRFENTYIALQYITFALAGIPYMGVGRNLAYRKEIYFKNKGFASHAHIISGDDDLFINQVANETNTRVMIHPESHTTTLPKNNLHDWIIQKRRHITSGKMYKTGHKILLGTEIVTRILFYFMPLGLIWMNQLWPVFVAIFMIRIAVQYIIYILAMKKFKQTDFLFFVPFFDFIYPFFQFSFVLLNKFDSKHIRWI